MSVKEAPVVIWVGEEFDGEDWGIYEVQPSLGAQLVAANTINSIPLSACFVGCHSNRKIDVKALLHQTLEPLRK